MTKSNFRLKKMFKYLSKIGGNDRGFSLVEVLVTLLLNVVVLGAIYTTMITSQRLYISEEEGIDMQQEARVAMDVMVRDIRRAGNDPMQLAFTGGNAFISTAKPNIIRLLADLPQDENGDGDNIDSVDANANNAWDDGENENGDGVLNDEDEDITFCLAPHDGNLLPTGPGPWTLVKRVPDGAGGTEEIPLCGNVTDLEFRYILKTNAGSPNQDTLPLSFEDRWSGASGAAVNASTYTTNQRLITRVLVKFAVRSSNPDRVRNDYQSILLQEDIDVRRVGY
jgi:prepilin-type N-terminal cleavage/methylation domain-containing protein